MADKFKAEDYRELYERLMSAKDDDVTAILSNNFNVVLGALKEVERLGTSMRVARGQLDELEEVMDRQTYDDKLKYDFDTPEDMEFCVMIPSRLEGKFTKAMGILHTAAPKD